jgi:transcriptional regulator with XRE-family HTH domain
VFKKWQEIVFPMRGDPNSRAYLDHGRLKKEIGQRLRKARLARKISMKTISSGMEVCYQCIWKYEEGITDIPITRFLQYCKGINVEPNTIIIGLLPDTESKK